MSRSGPRPPGSPASGSISRWTAGPPRNEPRSWSGTRPTRSTSASSPTTGCPAAIRATVADRDNIDSEDQVVLDLDTFHDRRRAFFFGVNPLGVQTDGVRSEGAGQVSSLIPGQRGQEPRFHLGLEGADHRPRATRSRSGFPSRACAIPAASGRAGASTSPGSSSAPATPTPGPTCAAPTPASSGRRARSADCTISGTGVTVEAQPFVTATANGSRDPATGEFVREDVDPDAGLNLRLGFTSYALDATLNPDFSQVESDEGQVTVNERFALFFPGEAALLPRGHRAVRHAADAGLHPPDRESEGRRQVHRQVRPARRGASDRGGRGGDAARTPGSTSPGCAATSAATRSPGSPSPIATRAGVHNRVLAGDFRYVWGLYYAQFQYGALLDHAGRRRHRSGRPSGRRSTTAPAGPGASTICCADWARDSTPRRGS